MLPSSGPVVAVGAARHYAENNTLWEAFRGMTKPRIGLVLGDTLAAEE